MKFVVLLTILALAFTSVAGQQEPKPQSQLSQNTSEEIVLSVTATDKDGGFVRGLKSGDFEVSIGKKPARIVSLTITDSPISIGILLDTSGSVWRGPNKNATKSFVALREAIRHFLEASNRANEYFLIGFNIKPQLIVDWTSDPSVVIDKFNDLNVYGETALYDTCYLALNKLNNGHHSKRVLLLISDGQDNSSKYTFKELRDFLRESDVLLYSINFPNDLDVGSSLGMEGVGVLDEFSFISGGRVFDSRDGALLELKHANSLLETIATELRNQYTLSVVPGEPLATKKWHKIKVKVNLSAEARRQMKRLDVRVREGVYAH